MRPSRTIGCTEPPCDGRLSTALASSTPGSARRGSPAVSPYCGARAPGDYRDSGRLTCLVLADDGWSFIQT